MSSKVFWFQVDFGFLRPLICLTRFLGCFIGVLGWKICFLVKNLRLWFSNHLSGQNLSKIKQHVIWFIYFFSIKWGGRHAFHPICNKKNKGPSARILTKTMFVLAVQSCFWKKQWIFHFASNNFFMFLIFLMCWYQK